MERYLSISATFLDPLYHGMGDGGRSEWPPSPMRVFQALLAGSRTSVRNMRWSGQGQDDLTNAFQWLERQPPPIIISPNARLTNSSYTLFVPNNDSDEVQDRQDRLTSKYPHPRRIDSQDDDPSIQPTIYYVWSISEEDWTASRPCAELIAGESRYLMALGWGIDQVVGDGKIVTREEIANISGERWRPYPNDTLGRGELRVPKEGSLADLEARYESFCSQLEGGSYIRPQEFRQFDMVRYVRSTQLPYRPYSRFELPEGCGFRQEITIEVAAMLRSLVCRPQNRTDFQEQFPNDDTSVYLAGHVGKENHTPPRFSYLPLPTIGGAHSDGMVRRLLIAEPYGGDGSRAQWASQRLEGQTLQDNRGNERGQLLALWRNTSRRMVNRYVGEHRIWSTVTPAILPGFDDGKQSKAEELLVKALHHAGIPLDGVTDIALRRAPFWVGASHPRDYRRPKYLNHLPAWHARIEFRESVPGPFAVGPGRHAGLGIMAGSNP